jgi:hypothetical protein
LLSFLNIYRNDGSQQQGSNKLTVTGSGISEVVCLQLRNQATESAEATLLPHHAESCAKVIRQSLSAMPFGNKNCTDNAAAIYIQEKQQTQIAN